MNKPNQESGFIRSVLSYPAAALLLSLSVTIVSPATSQAQMDIDAALDVQTFPTLPPTPSGVLLRNATVWTMEQDGILQETDIRLVDGKIDAIGKNLEAGPDDLVIDATGKHITPGIVDAHSHSAAENTDVNEGVPSVSAEVRIEDIVEPRSSDIYYQLAGGVTTIHILHGSANAIGGQNAMIKMRWNATRPEDLMFKGAPPTIKFALGENPKQANFNMPGRDPRYPATRMGVAAVIRDAFNQASIYREEWARYNALDREAKLRTAPPRRDLRLEPLVEILNGERSIHAHAYRADEMLMLMRLAEDLGFKIGTFQHVLEGYQIADEMAAHGAHGSTFSDWWSFKMEAFEAIPYNAAIMEERGVLVSLNSDDSDLARRLNLEAAKMLRYGGLDPANALAMVTINPARQLGIDDRVGSLTPGKDADIVVWSGSPLSVYTHATHAFVDGQLMFSRERDLEHRARVAEAREILLADIRGEKEDDKDAGNDDDEDNGQADQDADADSKAETITVKPEYTFAPAAGRQSGPTAIVGATIHPMDGPAIENGVVVFDAGRIVAVGGPETQVPADAERIEATGKDLWPGMIHTHTVLGISEIDSVAGTVDVAETGDINADADVAVAIDATSTHFPVARSGGITHAVVVPSGGMVAGSTALIRTDGWNWEDMTAVRRHSLVLRWPDPIPARYARLLGREDETLADRIKESEEQIKSLNELVESAKAYRKALAESARKPEFDPQLDAMIPVLEGKQALWVSAREKHAIIAAVEWAELHGIRIVITDARDAYLVPELLAGRVPVVLQNIVNSPPRPDDPYDVLYSLPARLEEAGVLFSIASGTFSGGSGNARHAPLFAGIAAAYGLDREAAYRSVTLNAAKILGVDDVLGSITPGKSASLVLTQGDFLEPSSIIEQVWIDGHKSSMDDIHKQADRKWRARPKSR